MLQEIVEFNVSRLANIREHSLKCHRFVAKSMFIIDHYEG